jgi:uncharacterized protein
MFLTALLMGLAGSLHCAGMCSPLAFAVTNRKSPAMMNRVLYNMGRITTYGLLGAITATVGFLSPLSKYQNLLSIILGIGLITMAMLGITGARLPFITSGLVKFTTALKSVFSKHIGSKSKSAMLLLGSLNGLLPCGLTFLALSFTITVSGPVEGFGYMFVFGLGTLPVMVGLVSIADIVKNKIQWNISRISTGLMVVSGILLIARVFLMHPAESHGHEINLVEIVICR